MLNRLDDIISLLLHDDRVQCGEIFVEISWVGQSSAFVSSMARSAYQQTNLGYEHHQHTAQLAERSGLHSTALRTPMQDCGLVGTSLRFQV